MGNGKKLHKSIRDKKISGVCAGIAEYFNIDPAIVRIIWVIATILFKGFVGIIVYIALSLILPDGDPSEPEVFVREDQSPSDQPKTVIDVEATEKK